jgi:hypothetical protein
VKTGMSGGGTDRSPLTSMPNRCGARPAASPFVPGSGFQPPSRCGCDGEAGRPSVPGRRLACRCQPLASDRIEGQPDGAHHSHRNTPVVSSSTGSASHRLGTADPGPLAPLPPAPGPGGLVPGGSAFGTITAGAVVGGLVGRGAVVGGLVGSGAVVGGLARRGAMVGGLARRGTVVGGLVDRGAMVGGLVDRGAMVGGLVGRGTEVGGLVGRGTEVGGLVAVTDVGGGLVVTAPVLGGPVEGGGASVVGGAVEAGGATVVGGAVTLTATVVGGPVVAGCPVTVVSASAPRSPTDASGTQASVSAWPPPTSPPALSSSSSTTTTALAATQSHARNDAFLCTLYSWPPGSTDPISGRPPEEQPPGPPYFRTSTRWCGAGRSSECLRNFASKDEQPAPGIADGRQGVNAEQLRASRGGGSASLPLRGGVGGGLEPALALLRLPRTWT